MTFRSSSTSIHSLLYRLEARDPDHSIHQRGEDTSIRSTSTFVSLAFRLFPGLGIWESVKSGKVMFSAKGGMNFGFPWWYGGGKRDTIDLPSLVFVVCFRVLRLRFTI
jgi:hypothetical protein